MAHFDKRGDWLGLVKFDKFLSEFYGSIETISENDDGRAGQRINGPITISRSVPHNFSSGLYFFKTQSLDKAWVLWKLSAQNTHSGGPMLSLWPAKMIMKTHWVKQPNRRVLLCSIIGSP